MFTFRQKLTTREGQVEAQQAYQLGQRVSVRVNEQNQTARTGTVQRVVWHFNDACFNYYLEVDGKRVGKRYRAIDLVAEDP
jgi:hypothetical protein